MAVSSLSSPLCTWFLAACMSIACEKDHLLESSIFQYPKRLTQKSRHKKLIGSVHCSQNLLSSFQVSGMQSLMSSCLSLEPFEVLYNSNRSSSSLNSIFSLFGSKSSNRRQMQKRSAVHSGGVAVAVQPEKEIILKKKPLTKNRRVVVTGMGVVTSIGQDADTFYNNLLDGVSGISEIEAFDCSQFPTKIAGEIKSFSADGCVSPKLFKRADKSVLYLLTAGKKALADAGITEQVMDVLDKTRCGVIIGSALGGMKIFNDAIEALRVSYKKMNPFCVPFATTNVGSAILAMDLGWMGPNYSISSACATSNFCILNSANHIIRGETDLMLCGGSDAAIIPIGLGGFVACRTLSQRNDDPTKASRPWDTDRDGFVLGEGAGVLLLEELEHAKRRGAKIYSEFLGGSFTCDAYHMTDPHPDGMGIALCIEQALVQSGVSKENVNYINAHATSTLRGDLTEFQAIVRCFGQNPEVKGNILKSSIYLQSSESLVLKPFLQLRVNSTKSMIGHLLGASGAVEAVATIKAIQTGWVHPNINLENPDEAVDRDLLVGTKKESLDIKVALSNSFGFGGHNSSILFAPYK
ncbi:3-oxoacyl-[acyl-carrier-protein] synthase II, chloroplastic isoform X3 [Manihot esculenta]|uniref:3-oxoacyl-[acyl-carrier-protein] synthase II, chloroplastic isoform X3 n=1 Tax=Manihot esculenta TaxID=3983 RepID=UPI001CC82FA3|nr:3-oxoacyl-[acyl-carrier-protein] synthase II, chloroplastic isoform X3 [Manihot esculenta]